MVGTSGNEAMRAGEDTAMGRNRPDWICVIAATALLNANGTCPPSSAINAGPSPG